MLASNLEFPTIVSYKNTISYVLYQARIITTKGVFLNVSTFLLILGVPLTEILSRNYNSFTGRSKPVIV